MGILPGMRNMDNSESRGQQASRHETIAGLLASALDMEDQVSNEVYEEYMRLKRWPPGFDEGVFREIKKRLAILIRDTKRHKQILDALVKEHGGNEQR